MSDTFNTFVADLKRRRWEHMRSKCLTHVPTFAGPGLTPTTSVGETVASTGIPERLIASNKLPHAGLIGEFEEVPGLRETVLSESIFLLHKARHVMGASEFLAVDGMRTWSLSDAYQASFFAAKAILGFLGISFTEHNNKAFVLDLYPIPVVRSDEYSETGFYYLGTKPDHRSIWELFQRALGIATVPIWPRDPVNKLKACEAKYFSKQRNTIHYKNHGWLLNDLHIFDNSAGFGVLNHWGQSNRDLDFDRPDISLVVAITVLRLGIDILSDLERSSRKLSPEIALLHQCIADGRHPMYAFNLVH